jgi:hypothetical protein
MTKKLTALMLIVFSVVGFSVPTGGGALQTALAQVIDADSLIQETRDQVEQEIEQEAEQEAEQEQEQDQSNEQSAEQSNEAEVSQDESNEQANAIVTGDNTASTTQVGDNEAVDNELEAESEGGDAGDTSADLSQNVDNEATTIQDSSADGNVLTNENVFGDDIAVIDQENIAEQNAANIGIQEQDLTQTIDQIQQAANLNVDFDVQVGVQQPPPPLTQPPGAEPTPGAECPSGFTFNPDTDLCERIETAAVICPPNHIYNPETNQCEDPDTGVPVCPPGTLFDPVRDACVTFLGIPLGPPGCNPSDFIFNPEIDLCEGIEGTAPPECPSGFTFNPATDRCERTVTRPPS